MVQGSADDPQHRYADAGALRDDLQRLRGGFPLRASGDGHRARRGRGLHGRDAAFREQFRQQVLATTVADLRAVAARHLDPARGVIGVVTHAGEKATIDAMDLPQFTF